MPADGDAGADLDAELARAADATGFVPFDRFMETALYAPGRGRYARRPGPLGPSGDFYTAAHVTPLFGRTIAGRIREVRARLGAPSGFSVVEVGVGDGALAAAIVPELAGAAAEYIAVDRSEELLRPALERLAPVAHAAGLALRSARSLAEAGPVTGVVLANELLDALPARRLRWTGTAWSELGARRDGGRWIAAERPAPAPVRDAPAPEGLAPGQIFEYSPAAEAWVRELADHLAGGLAIVVDYGAGTEELLRGHPEGTLAAVRAHRPIADPFDRPGSADLSVFVNFDRLRAAARRAGLVELAFRAQAEALGAWGFPERFDAAVRSSGGGEAEVRLRLAVKNLLFGFERFRALELAAPASAGALRALT